MNSLLFEIGQNNERSSFFAYDKGRLSRATFLKESQLMRSHSVMVYNDQNTNLNEVYNNKLRDASGFTNKILDQAEIDQLDQQSISNGKKIIGMLIFSFAMLIFAFNALLIKVTSQKFNLTTQELMYYFNLVSLLLMWLSSRLHQQDLLDIPPDLRLPLLKRVAGGFFSDIFLYMSFRYTNYGKAICIMLTQNIMIPFVAKLFLNETIRRQDLIASAVSFVGMVLIVQPFGDPMEDTPSHNDATASKSATLTDILGVLLSLGAALAGSISVVFNKCIADNLHWSIINFYYILSNIILCPIWSFLQQRDDFPVYHWQMFAYIFCIGITFSLIQSLMTVSIKMMSAAMAGILFYLLVCFGYIFDYFFLGTQIGWMEILGAVIIVSANVILGLLIAFKFVN